MNYSNQNPELGGQIVLADEQADLYHYNGGDFFKIL
jgi:hypothetical protein